MDGNGGRRRGLVDGLGEAVPGGASVGVAFRKQGRPALPVSDQPVVPDVRPGLALGTRWTLVGSSAVARAVVLVVGWKHDDGHYDPPAFILAEVRRGEARTTDRRKPLME